MHAPETPASASSSTGRSASGQVEILDDLIRLRAADATQSPILAYPRHDEAFSYAYFRGRDLDTMTDRTSRERMEDDIVPDTLRDKTVAILSQSDLNMVVTFFSLARLGCIVMMLSSRLSADACVSLLDTVGCTTIPYGRTPTRKPVFCSPIGTSMNQPMEKPGPVNFPLQTANIRKSDTAVILHSSGSTGLPKPLYLSNNALVSQMRYGPGLSSFNSLPWYHLYGLTTALQAMYSCNTAFMWDVSRPLTANSLTQALDIAKPASVHCVPYTLQLLIETPNGIDRRRSCKMATYGGAPCPGELGDLLVANGVRLGGLFGSFGGRVHLAPEDDRDWSYLQFFDRIQRFARMKWVSGSLYECVYLPGHPSLSASNADDGSYHSRDLFVQHPTHPKRWKYVARRDDRVTLINGEKVLPHPIEGTIRQHPLVDEAVVVGVQKAEPGLLIFRAAAAQDTPAEEVLDHIAMVEEANARAEQFSRISRAMVTVLPAGAACPRTDKGLIIRAQVYDDFEDDISKMYSRCHDRSGALQLSVDDTAAHLLRRCQNELRLPISTVHEDLYSQGVDSLQVIQLRRQYCRDFKFADAATVPQNLVYEAGNISRLAELIYAIQHGQDTQHEDEWALARDWVEQYSSFSGTPGSGARSNEKAAILTGATGSIGAHLLRTLLADETISTVYCLTRRSNPHDALFANFRRKQITIPPAWAERIVALQSDLAQSDLGVGDKRMRQMKRSVSLIIHVAWPVNFTLPLPSFEPHVKGLRNLISFSLSVDAPVPALLLFCSSVSTALASPAPEIEETPMGPNCALDMGYSRSKFVGEQLVSRAREAGAHAYTVRIGQVSGHSERGLWNDSEAIALMIRSALTLGALPDLDISCSWLPVDHLAACLQEIADACLTRREAGLTLSHRDDSVYNLVNPRRFTWSVLLEELRRPMDWHFEPCR
ncbi:putative NRPS-like protein biosynthetic cluster [Aspergillus luchuensis]|nr:putative NRPS-like protein biosynthetic cluster [Aspergillus luchuensis]